MKRSWRKFHFLTMALLILSAYSVQAMEESQEPLEEIVRDQLQKIESLKLDDEASPPASPEEEKAVIKSEVVVRESEDETQEDTGYVGADSLNVLKESLGENVGEDLIEGTLEDKVSTSLSATGEVSFEREAQSDKAPTTQSLVDYSEPSDEASNWAVNMRYLGLLSSIGLERKVYGRVSLGLYYGRYQGKIAGSDELGFIPDLHHAALQANVYLGKEILALTQGPVLRFAAHANQQKENELVKSVQVDGVDVIVPGETRWGTLLGIGYYWQKNWFSASVGAEYLTLGPLKNLVPLAVSVGINF